MTDPADRASRDGIDAALDRALASVLAPPALPPDFRAHLVARAQLEARRDLAPRRRELEIDYTNQARRLRSAHVRQQLEALPTIAAACVAAGAVVAAFAPFGAANGIGSTGLLYAVAAAGGTAIGWSVGFGRLGRFRWL
jgi:hypothetical protein